MNPAFAPFAPTSLGKSPSSLPTHRTSPPYASTSPHRRHDTPSVSRDAFSLPAISKPLDTHPRLTPRATPLVPHLPFHPTVFSTHNNTNATAATTTTTTAENGSLMLKNRRMSQPLPVDHHLPLPTPSQNDHALPLHHHHHHHYHNHCPSPHHQRMLIPPSPPQPLCQHLSMQHAPWQHQQSPRRPGRTPRAPDYYANVGAVIESLRADVPLILHREPQMHVYADNIVFTERASGYAVFGKHAYCNMLWAVRVQFMLFFASHSVAIQSLYHDNDAGIVYLRWRLQATPRVYGLIRNPPTVIYDAMSVYKINENGFVAEHSLENSAPVRPRLTPLIEDILSLGTIRIPGRAEPAGVGVGSCESVCSRFLSLATLPNNSSFSPALDVGKDPLLLIPVSWSPDYLNFNHHTPGTRHTPFWC